MSTEETMTKDVAVPSTLLTPQTDTVPVLAEDDLVEETEPPSSTIIVNPIADANMEDVLLTDAAENTVASNRKS